MPAGRSCVAGFAAALVVVGTSAGVTVLGRFDRGGFWIVRSCGLGLGGWWGAGSWPVRMLSGCEGLDDDHGPAASRARMWRGSVVGLVLVVVCVFGVLGRLGMEEFTGASQVLGAPAIGEEAVVSDAMEALRQDVEQEAADELVVCEGHGLVAVGPLAR